MKSIKEQANRTAEKFRSSTINKLNKLYNGRVMMPQENKAYINLSAVQLTPDQEELLNLGLNCHVQSKFDILDKKTELETLFQDLVKKQQQNKITISSRFKDLLRAEATKVRGNSIGKIMTPNLRIASKELRNNSDIVIRRADKSSMFVILNKEDYKNKLDQILADNTKFQKINRNPVEELKVKLNKLIKEANKKLDEKLPTLIGHYTPGYIYGNVKIHKVNNPLISSDCTNLRNC